MDSSASSTVLIVDDEVMVRTICARILKRHGLKTVDASDGEEALELFKTHQQQLRAVLLDLHLGRGLSTWVVEACKASNPRVPFIVMSGWTSDMVREQFGCHPPEMFLDKPFRGNDLTTALDKLELLTAAKH